MPKVRLGVALLIPPPVAAEVEGLRRACGDGALDRIPSHLTLVPPVNVRDDRLPDAVDVLRAAAGATRPFRVTLGPPATFLPDTPVLFLAVGGDGLPDVHALRDRVFNPPLERKLTWPFVPHVTLADELPEARIDAALAALAGYTAEVAFERVHLLQEGPGRVWTPIADAPFGPPAVVGRGGLDLELSVSDRPDPEGKAFSDREWPLVRGVALRRPFAVTARRDGAVVGLADGWSVDRALWLDGLVVDAAHRGQHVRADALAAVLSLAADRDCTEALLQTVPDSRADAFYRARGWTEASRLGGRVVLRRLL